MIVEFTKMHGCSNDYIYVDSFTQPPLEHPEKLSQLWSRPHVGIGSDGLILIEPSSVADCRMRIFNADGSEAMMCGNGVRCVGKYVYDHHLVRHTELTVETLSGIKHLQLHLKDGLVNFVTVDMGQPTDIAQVDLGNDYPIKTGIRVSMGNPHVVLFVDDAENVPLAEWGPCYEHHPLFPDRVNTEFAEINGQHIRMRVWERGSGITLACGTGACATAVAATFAGLSLRHSTIVMDGGDLDITWREENNHVLMRGPAVEVFRGRMEWPQ